MEKERFLSMLDNLQPIQRAATLNGVYSFDISTKFWKADPTLGDEPDEFVIVVTIFKAFDDSDDDYGRFEFFDDQTPADWFRTLNRIKYFVGLEG